jgi:hypothetical protein
MMITTAPERRREGVTEASKCPSQGELKSTSEFAAGDAPVKNGAHAAGRLHGAQRNARIVGQAASRGWPSLDLPLRPQSRRPPMHILRPFLTAGSAHRPPTACPARKRPTSPASSPATGRRTLSASLCGRRSASSARPGRSSSGSTTACRRTPGRSPAASSLSASRQVPPRRASVWKSAARTPSPASSLPTPAASRGRVFEPRASLAGATDVPLRNWVPRESWRHVALVRDGEQVRVYLDGRLEPEVSGASAPPSAADQIWIGGRSDGQFGFEGRIDEVAFYGRALAADEVKRHYEAATGR